MLNEMYGIITKVTIMHVARNRKWVCVKFASGKKSTTRNNINDHDGNKRYCNDDDKKMMVFKRWWLGYRNSSRCWWHFTSIPQNPKRLNQVQCTLIDCVSNRKESHQFARAKADNRVVGTRWNLVQCTQIACVSSQRNLAPTRQTHCR